MSTNVGGKLTSGGGITGPQTALAQYGFGEGLVGNAYQFGQMPHSTGLTQADVGTGLGAAQQEASLSQADQQALSSFLNQQFGTLSSGLGSILGAASGGSGSNTNTSGSSGGGSGVA